jgi:FKBP-type peptidyl-prolyl cis-trans isomerase FkpA
VTRVVLSTALLAAAVSLLPACSSEPTAPEPQVIEELEFHPLLEVDLEAMTQTASGLYYEDLVVGDGLVAEGGDSVFVAYAGYLADGRQFDAGEISFTLLGGNLIPGFEEAVSGMAVGGARKALLPPELGYGSSGFGGIPGGAVLVFDLQLRRVVEAPFQEPEQR